MNVFMPSLDFTEMFPLQKLQFLMLPKKSMESTSISGTNTPYKDDNIYFRFIPLETTTTDANPRMN